MLSGIRYLDKKGSIFPIVLVVLVFCSVMIYTVSLQVSRSIDRIRTFGTMSVVQNTAANVAELALGYLVTNYADSNFADSWEDLANFEEFVSSRSGLEGTYWETALGKITVGNCWNLSEESGFVSLLGNLSWARDYDVGAVAYKYDTGDSVSDYIIISWAERSGVRGYALAIAAEERQKEFPVFSFGNIERSFSELKSAKGNGWGSGGQVFSGDLFYGPVTVLGEVEVAQGNDPANIFLQGIAAHQVDFSGGYDFDYTQISTPVDTYLSDLREEFLEEFASYESVILDLASPSVPELNVSSVLEVYPPSPEDQVLIEFNGGEVVFGINEVPLVTIPEQDFVLRILIHGDAVFDYNINTPSTDAQKAQRVDGNFEILVEGDITLNSNLVYDSLYGDFNNGNGGSPVVNHAINSVQDFAVEVSSKEKDDSLTVISIGGDIIITYGQGVSGEGNASHGVRILNGRFLALPDENGSGGTFRLPDVGTVISGNRISQLFVVGALIGDNFGAPDDYIDEYLDMLVAVSDEAGGTSSEVKKLRLIGIRIW